MQKIPSLFKRDYEGTRLVYNEVVEGCEWVLNGEGIATEKFDGTSCMIKDGQLYKRYDRKLSKSAMKRKRKDPNYIVKIEDFKPAPDGWESTMDNPDFHTGHYTGWLPVDFDLPENKWHKEARRVYVDLPDGTYELIGEKVQGNPYNVTGHDLLQHGRTVLEDVPRDYEGIKQYLSETKIEGIVWHHPDGRMCKIKRRDFGFEWGNS